MPVRPSISADVLSWDLQSGDRVRVTMLLPRQRQITPIDEAQLWANSPIRPQQLKWQVRVAPESEEAWTTFLNVIDVHGPGAASSVQLVTSPEDDVQGALVRRPGNTDLVAVFNAAPGPALRAPVGRNSYDAANANLLRQVRLRRTGFHDSVDVRKPNDRGVCGRSRFDDELAIQGRLRRIDAGDTLGWWDCATDSHRCALPYSRCLLRINTMLNNLYRHAKRSLLTRALPPVIRSVRAESLTYLDDTALEDLYNEVRALETEGRDGILIEAGCALGGSAIVIATAKSPQRPFFVYDVFDMIPAPSEHDDPDVHERYDVIRSGQSEGIGGHKYYGYEENLLNIVIDNFRRHRVPVDANSVHLIQGPFEERLRVTEPVALAHIDGDWYESVMTSLQRIEPHLTQRGVLVIDDYDAWSGCRKAVDQYFSDKRDRYQFIRKARLHIVPRRGSR